MAVKTFTTGSVLTAADTNTYLANAGLVYVTSTTVSGATAIQIDNCFTSTYDNYRITFQGLTSSAGGDWARIRYVAGTTPVTAANYYGSNNYSGSISGASYVPSATSHLFALVGNIAVQISADIMNPQVAKNTTFVSHYIESSSDFASGQNAGIYFGNTQFQGLQLFNSSGFNFTGTLSIYGYRKA